MEFSEQRLARAAQLGSGPESRIASRLIGDLPAYTRWEHTHRDLMRSVATQGAAAGRTTAVRKVALRSLHRKAPFEYLRAHRVAGQARHRLVGALFGNPDYAHCVIGEHEAWMCSTASLLCTDALCRERFGDSAFADALRQYESAYTDYFRAFCEAQLAEAAGRTTAVQPLLPYMRYRLKVIREHLLAGAPEKSDYAELRSLYAATGDTQPLKVLKP
jgi:hypothetical protein